MMKGKTLELARKLADQPWWDSERSGMWLAVVDIRRDKAEHFDSDSWETLGSNHNTDKWEYVPDLEHPATTGMMLDLLERTQLLWSVYPPYTGCGEYWVVRVIKRVVLAGKPELEGYSGTTFGEALARALIGAKGERQC